MKQVTREEYKEIVRNSIVAFDEANSTNFRVVRQMVQVYRVNDTFVASKEPAKFGVKWCALGVTDSESATNFANIILKASELADMLTKLELVVKDNLGSKGENDVEVQMEKKVEAHEVSNPEAVLS